MNLSCKFCSFPISENFYFCPNCGKKLKEPPVSISITKQIGIYAYSILLPPLGIIPGVKYLRQKNQKARIIGIIAILLTIVSSAVTIYAANKFISAQLEQTNKQLQYLGY